MRELGIAPILPVDRCAAASLRPLVSPCSTLPVPVTSIVGRALPPRLTNMAMPSPLTKVDGHPYTLESASSRMSALPVDGMVVIVNRMPADFGTFERCSGMQTVLLRCWSTRSVLRSITTSSIVRAVVEYLLGQRHKTVHFISCPERSLGHAA